MSSFLFLQAIQVQKHADCLKLRVLVGWWAPSAPRLADPNYSGYRVPLSACMYASSQLYRPARLHVTPLALLLGRTHPASVLLP